MRSSRGVLLNNHPHNPQLKEVAVSANPKNVAVVSFLKKAIESHFEEHQLPHFLGGSRRFGYDRAESDTDLFVLVGDEGVEMGLVCVLNGLGFVETREPGYTTRLLISRVFVLSGIFHAVIFLKEDYYEDVLWCHDAVDQLLGEEPCLRQLARELRCQGVKGTTIYGALVNLAVTPQTNAG